MKQLSGGGWHSILYTLKMGWRVGFLDLWKAMRSSNACKTCALGMGGQSGGMKNEKGRFPEVCKKSLQAMVSDMQGKISPQFFKKYSINQLRTLSPYELERAGRLSFPVKCNEGATHYQPIEWNEALNEIANKIRKTKPNRSFFYFSGRSSNEAGFLLQLFARQYGTNNINNCSYYCHQASGVGLSSSLGTGTASLTLDDVENADLFFLFGGNPASNHPRLMTSLYNIRKKGGKVVVINPVVEPGLERFKIPSHPLSLFSRGKISDVYVQIKIGGDIALMTGIAKHLMEIPEGIDQNFVAIATNNFEPFRQVVSNTSWDKIEACSGINKSQIVNLAKIYAQSKGTVFGWTMGITHHKHGVANVQSIVNLALLRGMVGRKNAGLLPIRGHSNVQGIGSMSVVPDLKDSVATNLATLGISPPKAKGLDTMECIESAFKGNIDFGWSLGGNLYGSNPDAQFARQAFEKIGTKVYLNTTLNTGHAWGTGRETYILPVLARDEEKQSTTQESMFNFVRLSSGGVTRHSDLKSEVEIITEIAAAVTQGQQNIDWKELRNHDSIRSLISEIIPGYENVKSIGSTKKEFYIEGRLLAKPSFKTPDGKALFKPIELPQEKPLETNTLNLMTVRSEGQFNTVVYEEHDAYRGQNRRDIILINSEDMKSLKLKKDQRVNVKGPAGEMKNILVRPFEIKEGSALMYYPEANILLDRVLDSESKTPSFKSCPIQIVPQ